MAPRRAGLPASRRPAARPAAEIDVLQLRRGFASLWSTLVTTVFRSREACAAWFGVTFQCACNWWDGLNVPAGDRVAAAAMAFPDQFARIIGAGAVLPGRGKAGR